MNLSLFQTPGTIVFLDDDPGYLDMLALVLPKEWHARFFLRPQTCIQHLVQEIPPWEEDAWEQQQIISLWRETGAPLIPQVLEYWQNPRRYDLSRICVVDYSMPAMNGLQVLEQLAEWRGSRLLLTGQADEQIAVKAFNHALIEQFLPKQTPDISQRLMAVIRHMQAGTGNRQPSPWRATLSQRQYTLLRSPSISAALAELAARSWVEHVVIGSPFGILGRAADGQASWLQLEPASGLEELSEMADSIGVNTKDIEDIQQGRQLVDLELRQALGLTTPPQLRPAFTIGSDEPLYGALFAIDAPPTGNTYQHWLASRDERHTIS